MTPEQEQIRAAKAAQLLEEPLIKAAFDEIERAVVDNIETCPIEAPELRAQLCMMLAVNRKFRRIFQSHLETGKMASLTLERKKKFGIF